MVGLFEQTVETAAAAGDLARRLRLIAAISAIVGVVEVLVAVNPPISRIFAVVLTLALWVVAKRAEDGRRAWPRRVGWILGASYLVAMPNLPGTSIGATLLLVLWRARRAARRT